MQWFFVNDLPIFFSGKTPVNLKKEVHIIDKECGDPHTIDKEPSRTYRVENKKAVALATIPDAADNLRMRTTKTCSQTHTLMWLQLC